MDIQQTSKVEDTDNTKVENEQPDGESWRLGEGGDDAIVSVGKNRQEDKILSRSKSESEPQT